MSKPCKVKGCEKMTCNKSARGYCRPHYRKYMKYGDPLVVKVGRPLNERFNEKIKKIRNACWEWIGRKNKGGYGIFAIGSTEKKLAHRYSWETHNGHIPNNLCVLHKCDNPCCVNPDHLFLGTRADNIYDMMSKGRRKQYSKLKETDIINIRAIYKYIPKATQTKLADIYNVSPSNISLIVNRKNWNHI